MVIKKDIIINGNSGNLFNANMKSIFKNLTINDIYSTTSTYQSINLFSCSQPTTLINIDIVSSANGLTFNLFSSVTGNTDITLDAVNLDINTSDFNNVYFRDKTLGGSLSFYLNNRNFSTNNPYGFLWNFMSIDNIDIRNSKFNCQCSSSNGTIFPLWNSLILINNDFTYDLAYDENNSDYRSYLATISSTHDKCIILNNIMRKSTKAGTLLTSESKSNLKDSDVYDFNIIAT